jgi:serum response factor
MQSSSHSGVVSSNAQGVSIAGLNGQVIFPGANGSGQPHTRTEPNFIFENVDPTNLDGDDDSDGDEMSPNVHFKGFETGSGQPGMGSALKPGKKTKGRVKIKMEFIENKLRRYTTFSKRKTGIMKKVRKSSSCDSLMVGIRAAGKRKH